MLEGSPPASLRAWLNSASAPAASPAPHFLHRVVKVKLAECGKTLQADGERVGGLARTGCWSMKKAVSLSAASRVSAGEWSACS